MEEKDTGDLREELMVQPDISVYLKDNADALVNTNISEDLHGFLIKKSISKLDLARRAAMSEVYVRQIFSGRRTPSRDRLLCLCIAMEISIEETQRTLKRASYAPLYPKVKRDAIIEHGIVHGMTLDEINSKLYDEDEKSLF
ncbi:XRE family transcriptional regulator [Pseudoflavonifractor sp. 524-17]|uniref:helix-turn-helix domain-containing protein n=1 Tax=Pseudoflavonifractor sp. 524-17 TaxID=2304577 RepID=UPI00137A27F1|nr:helix-turn-helix transcriptional regulator [Pseudoflavonifractor sp. 524-17]NCE64401.1 XRE family transcriptional regulator [Pseudoflavonifractor sp. 524-17]